MMRPLTISPLRTALLLVAPLALVSLAACDKRPADPFAAAQVAMAKGEPRTALEHITAASETRPDDVEVQILAGDIAMAMGNADRAVMLFQNVVDRPQPSSLAKAKLAEANLMANYIGAAETSVAALAYDVPLAFTAAIGLAMAKGDYEKAYAKLDHGLERFPEDHRLVTIDAERLFAQARPDAARARLAPVLERRPVVAHAHRLAGQMALTRRDGEAASEHFKAVLKARPNDQTAMLAMAAIARDIGKEGEAANWINKANDAGEPHPIGLLFAAQMAYDAGNIDRAFELIETVPPAIASEPSFARLRGFIDAARGQYGAAILPLQSYLEQASDDYLARRILAEAYAEQGELANAWRTIEPILRDPQADSGALALALSLADATGEGDPAAIRALITQRQSAPVLAAELREAGAAIRAGDWAKADAIYAPLVDGAGRANAVLLNNAAAVKSRLGQHAKAVALARRALAIAPQSPQILDTLGWALWQEGKNRVEARALLTRAIEAAPGNDEIVEHWRIAQQDA
ncbi:MAG: tetratricopeptide repeat protein [Pseudomonadota bacterium]